MMKIWLLATLCLCTVSGCSRYRSPEESGAVPPPIVIGQLSEEVPEEIKEGLPETITETKPAGSDKIPVKVRGIYISAYIAGNEEIMDSLIQKIDETEINTVVIDFKDDQGRITCPVDSPTVEEIGAEELYIRNIDALMKKLKEHNIYVIARVVAFRDPYLAEQKPEWSLKLENGQPYRDKQGLAWVNPYKQEVWDYLVEIGQETVKLGFDEIQFDYIRFSTEKGIDKVVFDEADTKGRSKTDIITEFINYAYDNIKDQGVFISADVFGTIIGSSKDSEAVGQAYGHMAECLDYICPMIYPSHYGDGNFGIEHPDEEPYATVLAALNGSARELLKFKKEGKQAVVRPWLQDFTANYLKNHISYGPEQIRQQIQAVYDAGYDEWILWDSSCKYNWEGLKTPEEALLEEKQISESREILQSEAMAAAQSSTEISLLQIEGSVPEISKMPELPDQVAPAGPAQSEDRRAKVIIPQMQME